MPHIEPVARLNETERTTLHEAVDGRATEILLKALRLELGGPKRAVEALANSVAVDRDQASRVCELLDQRARVLQQLPGDAAADLLGRTAQAREIAQAVVDQLPLTPPS